MQSKYIFFILVLNTLVSCRSDSSNSRMIGILDGIRRSNYSRNNPFTPQAKLAFLDSTISNVSANSRITALKAYKAYTLLQVGDEKQSFTILSQLIQEMKPQDIGYIEVLKTYAIAALRFGERQNCVLSHSTESCLMPIKGMGVHRDPFGSSKAIAAYEALLKIDPTDLESQWLLNIAYMTLGQYPSKVPAAWLIPNLDKDTSQIDIKPFKDAAPKLRLDTKNKAGGMIVDDFNNDGLMDMITSDWGLDGSMHFFKNDGAGGFTDISASSGLGDFKGGLNIMQTDYNNDGLADILVLRGAWMPGEFGKQPMSLLKNNGDETFTDVTIESGLFSLHPTQAGVWRDFNNDGWLDLFVGNETSMMDYPFPCELFINDQHGGFKNVASLAHCDLLGFVKGVAAADYNNDGRQDIFISTCDGRRMLLKNKSIENGIPQFENVTEAAGLNDEHIRTFPTWFWDYDNDGWPDIFVCGYQPAKTIAYTMAAEALKRPADFASKMYLYHNNHDGTFSNVSKEAGLNSSVFAMGSNFGDIDNDGYLDMYLGTGNPEYSSLSPNKLFKNIGGKKFVDVTIPARVGNLQKGHGIAFTDIDNDGDQDISIEVGGAYPGDAYNNSLYINPGQNNNHWLYLNLNGKTSNRSAIGARIKLSFKENGVQRVIYRDENSGGSFGSSTLRREIGIGQANRVDELTITWPGTNAIQTFKNIGINQWLKITEGNDTPEKMKLKKLVFEIDPFSVFTCAPISLETLNK
jgi:FG-GAP-like repeat/ASPIC and UnbV